MEEKKLNVVISGCFTERAIGHYGRTAAREAIVGMGCTVESTGSINERIEIDSDINLLQATTCDIMARMCRNGLEDGTVRRYKDYNEKWELEVEVETERIAPFMGKRPEYMSQD